MAHGAELFMRCGLGFRLESACLNYYEMGYGVDLFVWRSDEQHNEKPRNDESSCISIASTNNEEMSLNSYSR